MAAYFMNKLHVEYIDGRLWELSEQLVYVRPTECIRIPKGFTTDFASIPRFFWRILPPVGGGSHAAYGPASVVHDYLYQTHVGSRKEADQTFLEAMGSLEVSWWRRTLMYLGVRAFGGIAWRNGEIRLAAMNRDLTRKKGTGGF